MASKLAVNGVEFTFTEVKGNAEKTYRSGDVNITPENIGTYSSSDIDKLLDNLNKNTNKTIEELKSTILDQQKYIEVLEELNGITYITTSDNFNISTNSGDLLVTFQS